MERYGYIRVSAKDQNPERQLLAMQEQQIKKGNIYLDKMSGKSFARPQYLRMLRRVKKGDIIIVKSIDRLGRDYEEILKQWRKITKEIGADIQVIDMPLLNTNSSHGDLTGVFIADLVLQILAYVAETERTFIKQRQAEGIVAAKQRGIQFGCKRKEVPEDFTKYYRLWCEEKISLRKAAEELKMNYSTFYRRCAEIRKKEGVSKEKCSKL